MTAQDDFAGWLSDIRKAAAVLDGGAPTLFRRCAIESSGVQDGWAPVGDRNGPGAKGGHADPTAAVALMRAAPDVVRRDLGGMIRAVRDAQLALEAAVECLRHSEPDNVAHLDAYWQRGGPCECCGRKVEGTAADKLKSGFCPSCYQAWWRAGRPERAPWIVVRRAWLDEQQAGGEEGEAA